MTAQNKLTRNTLKKIERLWTIKKKPTHKLYIDGKYICDITASICTEPTEQDTNEQFTFSYNLKDLKK